MNTLLKLSNARRMPAYTNYNPQTENSKNCEKILLYGTSKNGFSDEKDR